jgi:thymidine kinase
MFLENTVNHKEQFGWISYLRFDVFGKTEEHSTASKRAQFAKQK